MTTAPKQPQDRKPRAKKAEPVADAFSFDHNGETYTLAPTADHVTPGFVRRNRHEDEANVTYLLIEEMADDDTLDVIDSMSWPEHRAFHEAFGKHIEAFMGATLGE